MFVTNRNKEIITIHSRTLYNEVAKSKPININHYKYDASLGSASLEIYENAVINWHKGPHSYETTSYRANRSYTKDSHNNHKYDEKTKEEEIGLYYYGARYYAAWIGRWTAADPFKEKYQNLSPYNYVANNPMKYIDPDGRKIVIAGNQEYRGKVKKALAQLASTETGAKILQQIIESQHNIVINIGDGTNFLDEEHTTKHDENSNNYYVSFNPDDLRNYKGEGNVKRFPAASIGHELTHWIDLFGETTQENKENYHKWVVEDDEPFYKHENGGTVARTLPGREVNAIHVENIIRSAFKQQLRKGYLENRPNVPHQSFTVFNKQISSSEKSFENTIDGYKMKLYFLDERNFDYKSVPEPSIKNVNRALGKLNTTTEDASKYQSSKFKFNKNDKAEVWSY